MPFMTLTVLAGLVNQHLQSETIAGNMRHVFDKTLKRLISVTWVQRN